MVEATQGGGARALPNDRNPANTQRTAAITSGAATRVATVDATYTTPAGKKGEVGGARASTTNRGTAVNGIALTSIETVPNAGAAGVVLQPVVLNGEGVTQRELALGKCVNLTAGDAVRCVSESANSAAGSDVRHDSWFWVTEYDA